MTRDTTDQATSQLQTSDERRDMPTVLEKAVVMGDLSLLKPMERLEYYHAVCQSVGLNPLTKPFLYIKTKEGALVLYANKGATDQIRALRSISIGLPVRDTTDPLFATWLVTGTAPNGRTDTDIGSVSIGRLAGNERANAIMKALTKAKRRLTLSLAGLGNMLDESEVEAAGATPADVDPVTGELLTGEPELSPAQRMLVERAESHQAPEAAPEAATDATFEVIEAQEPPTVAVEAAAPDAEATAPTEPEDATVAKGYTGEEYTGLAPGAVHAYVPNRARAASRKRCILSLSDGTKCGLRPDAPVHV